MPRSMTHTAVGFAVFAFHKLDDIVDGGHVHSVAVKDLKTERQAFRAGYQSYAHLYAVGTTISAVTVPGLGIALAGAFKIGLR